MKKHAMTRSENLTLVTKTSRHTSCPSNEHLRTASTWHTVRKHYRTWPRLPKHESAFTLYSFVDTDGSLKRMVPKACMFGDRTSPRIACTYSTACGHVTTVLHPEMRTELTYVDDNIVFAVDSGTTDNNVKAFIEENGGTSEPYDREELRALVGAPSPLDVRSLSTRHDAPLLDSSVALSLVQRRLDCGSLL